MAKEYHKYTQEYITDIANKHTSQRDLAKELNISPSTVSNICKRYNIAHLLKKVVIWPTFEQVRQDCADGLAASDIAIKYGRDTSGMCKYIKKLGLSAKHKAENEEYRDKVSLTCKSLWQNEEYRHKVLTNSIGSNTSDVRARRSITFKKTTSTPEYKLKAAKLGEERWQNEDYRNKISKSMTELYISSEHKERLSKQSKENWLNKEYRDKIQATMQSQECKDRMATIQQDPVNRSKVSLTSKLLWQDPEYREKVLLGTNTLEYRKHISRKAKEQWQDPEYRDKTLLAIRSIDSRTKSAIIRQNTLSTLTKPHLKVNKLLDTLNIKYINEQAIGPYNFDIFIPNYNILIEVQGDYWHNLPDRKARDQAKSTYIKEYFPQYKLYYIWEHECLTEGSVLAKLKYWLGLDKVEQVDFNFGDLGVATPKTKEADQFLYNWHYQHHGRHGLDIGYYLNQELIALARFTSPHRNEVATSLNYRPQEVLELARFVIYPKYHKKNLATWLLARARAVVELEKPDIKCLVSFADTTYNHVGTIYKADNWTLNRIVEPNYWYVDQNGWAMHKKTLWNHAKSLGLSEREFIEMYNYTKVWGKEKYKFIKVIY